MLWGDAKQKKLFSLIYGLSLTIMKDIQGVFWGSPRIEALFWPGLEGYVTALTGRALDWQSRGQRFDPAILHQEKPWNHMVSRFFLIYGKLHKVAFVLNLCWTRGKIAHNFLFPATHFHNFFYIFIISTFCTNALIGKGFFCPFEKAQSKKCIFLSTLSFLRLCWISCWITNSSPLFSRTGTLVVPVPPHRS